MEVGPARLLRSLPTGFPSGSWATFPTCGTVPYVSPLFLVRTAVGPTKLATCWSLTRSWENNLRMQQNTQSIVIISKQLVAPKTHVLVKFIKQVFWG